MTEKALRFVLKTEKDFIGLIAIGMNKEATVWSPVLDALIDDDPQLAIRLATERRFQEKEVAAIREAFDLT